MTTLATDNFTRANQSGWGLASDGINTWSLVRGTSTFSIVSDQGAVSGNSGAFCNERCGSGTSADTEQVVTFNRVNSADVAGLFCRFADVNNWYSINIGEFANNLVFSKMVSGSYSDVAFGPSVTPNLSDTYAIRFRNVGTTIQARMWDTTGNEPSTWDIDTTDSTFSAAGGFGVLADPFTTTAMTFTSYNATDGSSGPTITTYSFTDTLSGTDSLTGDGGFSSTDTLVGIDGLSGAGAFSQADALNPSDALTGIAAFSGADSLSVGDSLLGTILTGFQDAGIVADNLLVTLATQFVDVLSPSDLLGYADVPPTPIPAPVPNTLVFAVYRSGVISAQYRDGVVTAGGR